MLYNILSAIVSTASKHKDTPLTASEAFSGILGSISLACWLFLLVPQVIENYRNQSAEALSLAFVIVWFLGDLANLFGALGAGLVPTVIAIGVYFCLSDAVLLGQILYYGIRNKRREGKGLLASVRGTVVEQDSGSRRFSDATAAAVDGSRGRRSVDGDGEVLEREESAQENEPLLSRKHSRAESYGAYTIPGSADPKVVRREIERRRSSSGGQSQRPRRKSSSAAAVSAQQEPLAKIFEEPDSLTEQRTPLGIRVVKKTMFILGVIAIGTFGWLIAYQTGTWKPTSPEPSKDAVHTADSFATPAGAQFLGYVSAVLYLTARLPQIWKNYREQSCEGLSILFFVLSLLGNATYGAGILAHSIQRDYVIKNVPWLIGSLGTMVEDVVVFWQFRLYRDNVEEKAIIDDAEGPSATNTRSDQRA